MAMSKKSKWNVAEKGIDTETFSTIRSMLAMSKCLIQEAGDFQDDLKATGLLDMTVGVCQDCIVLAEQQAEMLNILKKQNDQLIQRLDMWESINKQK